MTPPGFCTACGKPFPDEPWTLSDGRRLHDACFWRGLSGMKWDGTPKSLQGSPPKDALKSSRARK